MMPDLVKMPWSAIVLAIIQIGVILIWGVHVSDVVYDGQRMDRELGERIELLTKRVDNMDALGTRKLQIIEDRQNTVINRLNALSDKVYGPDHK